MSLLRSEALASLNDLITACREAADAYRLAAEKLQGTAVGQECIAAARRRDVAADAFAELVIMQDDVPNAPSGEKTLIESAVTSLKSAVGFDKSTLALENCRTKEQQLYETAHSVLRQITLREAWEKILTLESDVTKALENLD